MTTPDPLRAEAWDHNHDTTSVRPPLQRVQDRCPACIVGNAKRRAGDIAAPRLLAPQPAPPLDVESVNACLAELSESPLPGARYAYEVVKRRLGGTHALA